MNKKDLGLKLMEWHSGQWSALYSVGSTLFAGSMPKYTACESALAELTNDRDSVEEENLLALQHTIQLLAEFIDGNYFTECVHIHEGRGKNKKVTEETRVYRRMTLEECKALSYGDKVNFFSRQGMVKEVKVNGKPQTWKTRKDVRVPVKYGLYEYSYTECNVDSDGSEYWHGEILLVKEEE